MTNVDLGSVQQSDSEPLRRKSGSKPDLNLILQELLTKRFILVSISCISEPKCSFHQTNWTSFEIRNIFVIKLKPINYSGFSVKWDFNETSGPSEDTTRFWFWFCSDAAGPNPEPQRNEAQIPAGSVIMSSAWKLDPLRTRTGPAGSPDNDGNQVLKQVNSWLLMR